VPVPDRVECRLVLNPSAAHGAGYGCSRTCLCSTNITPIISDKDPQYSVYLDGLDKGCFVPDQRPLSYPGNPPEEWHQNFGGGQQYWWSNQNGRINLRPAYQDDSLLRRQPRRHAPRDLRRLS
jgi:hypothetical protein